MSDPTFDAFLEITLTVHRHVRITAPTMEEAEQKASALADAWMPHELTSAAKWPATEKPVISVGYTVLSNAPVTITEKEEGEAAA